MITLYYKEKKPPNTDDSLGLPSITKITCNNEPRLMTVQCSYRFKLAERQGFEPWLGFPTAGFRNRSLQPLG